MYIPIPVLSAIKHIYINYVNVLYVNIFCICVHHLDLMCVFQLSSGHQSVVLVLLLAVHCSLFLQTDGADIPKLLQYYYSCVQEHQKAKKMCDRDCELNNTCEPSRRFCKNICVRLAAVSHKKCFDEYAKPYYESRNDIT